MIRKKLVNLNGSLCVLIPKSIADLMDLKQGSEVELDYASSEKQIIIISAEKHSSLCSSEQEASKV